MSKNKTTKQTAVTAYSVVPKDSGYQIVKMIIVDGEVTSVEEIGNTDVWAITMNSISKLHRQDLGL